MDRKPRFLVLALAAALALCSALPALASAKQFHSTITGGATHTFITGIQVGTNNLDLENGTNGKCTSVVLDASYAGPTASVVTFTPTFSGCTMAGQNASINFNDCTFKVTTPAIGADNDHYTASADIVCATGGDIEINVPTAGCSVTIKAQTPGTPLVDLENVTTASANQDDILMTSTIAGIAYSTTGGGICGAAGVAKYTGQITFKGYSNSAHSSQVDLWIL